MQITAMKERLLEYSLHEAASMTRTTNFFDTQAHDWRERLAISVEVMRELSSYADPREMYRVFSHRMGQLFPTSRQITLSRRGVKKPQVRVTRFSHWRVSADPMISQRKFPVYSGGLFAELLYADEPQLLDELHLGDDDPAAAYLEGQQSLLAIPIFEGGVAQHMIVLTRESPAAFAPEQVPELVWMTNLFGRATQSLVLSQALQESFNDAAAELQAIAELQHSLLPRETPTLPDLEVAAHYSTANRAGGDYYDFFPQADGSLGVLIADVSGHGAPAAVLMAITHSIAHAATAPTGDPSAFLLHLNKHLADRYNQASGSFVTAFYLVHDPRRRTLRYASAGHVPPRVFKRDGSVIGLNRVQRLPLGINPQNHDYPEHASEFLPGETCIMFTDGVTDAVNARGSVFGSDRLHKLPVNSAGSASDILARLMAELDRFTNATPQSDDRTVVVIRAT